MSNEFVQTNEIIYGQDSDLVAQHDINMWQTLCKYSCFILKTPIFLLETQAMSN